MWYSGDIRGMYFFSAFLYFSFHHLWRNGYTFYFKSTVCLKKVYSRWPRLLGWHLEKVEKLILRSIVKNGRFRAPTRGARTAQIKHFTNFKGSSEIWVIYTLLWAENSTSFTSHIIDFTVSTITPNMSYLCRYNSSAFASK